ncbi:WALL-ASSOCIATED RECEPTOR KINASE-LIKE 21 [Salix koriyanagi]|uniref:WALL-ASSOCIATED RECEPTOR KINASE-LIKE 21 n=1 Tax=Salix koriyanagi TaxID=2511006 RepID=A0A9Q0WSG4_9ROSI|nr:WALL-ASSOCIATED RECEPTOR KINASE-LIKE 21 [Salix koriyanagi]
MAQQPHHSFLRLSILTLICSLYSIISADPQVHECTSKQDTYLRSSSPCPPFASTPPPFPFSLSPGCGHPFFQLKCSSPRSTISINNLSFALLHFDPNSSSLLLSPQLSSLTSSTPIRPAAACSSDLSSIPAHSINLSGSPFRVSDSYCSRLSVLRSCSPPNLPNCSHCPWECKLVKNPLNLLRDCRSGTHSLQQQGCQTDILEYLDNFLKIGFQVEYDESQDPYFSSCRECKSKKGICGFNSSDPEKSFLCFQSRTPFSPTWIHQNDRNRVAILCSVSAALCLVIAVLVYGIVFSLLPPAFTFEELESSTNRFDPKRKIGDGGFGSVYLGQLSDARIVAVKYLHRHNQVAAAGRAFSTKSFCNEILILSSIHHSNLVKLHGYCSDPRGLLLVYDYVPNGTLADHLHGTNNLHRKSSLTWQVRLDIALQTALAIEYLHFSVKPPIVHRDITSSNIFIEKDMRIKVGDFGLSRLLVLPEPSSSSSGYVCTGPQGTPGYLDPDYHRSDKREMALADHVVSKIQMGLLRQVVDPVLGVDGETMKGIESVAELAFRCVAADKDDRPDSREVVEELRRIRSQAIGIK